MIPRITTLLVLAFLEFAAPAYAQGTSTIRIYVESTVRRSTFEFQVERRNLETIGRDPVEDNGYFRVYEHVVTWPVLGSRRPRSDFRLTAKLQAGVEGRTFFLRLRPASPPVRIYIFNRPAVTSCRWYDRPPTSALEGIYRQLAEAEAMLLIRTDGRCGIVNMQKWTRRWAELSLKLWEENESIVADPDVTSAIEWAHANPVRPVLSFWSGRLALPEEYVRARARERRLASRFR